MTHEQFSKKGGSVKSEAKKKAAQENWKKAQAALREKRALANIPKTENS